MTVSLAPFPTSEDHRRYAALCGLEYEPGTAGFAIFEEEAGVETEPLGAVTFKFIGNTVYLTGVASVQGKADEKLLEDSLRAILGFFAHAGIHSVIYPVQTPADAGIAEALSFDRMSDTLYGMEFEAKEENPRAGI